MSGAWVDHNGEVNPLHGNEYVQVRFRCGIESGLIPSGAVQWAHGYRGVSPHKADVVAYRAVGLPEAYDAR